MVVGSLIATAQEDLGALENVFTSSQFPGIVLLSASGILGMIFIMRWLVRFQKEFTNFYIEENKKLRLEVTELKKEVDAKEDEIQEARSELDHYKRETMYRMAELEIKIAAQDEHIGRLNRIIERRKLTEEDQ